jgi:hypothetical protein
MVHAPAAEKKAVAEGRAIKRSLCQEDLHLLERVRHIHLNPLRAKLVDDLMHLDTHAYGGSQYWLLSGWTLTESQK